MAESSYPLDGDEIAGPGAAVPQRVEGRDAGAHERSRFFRPQRVGDMRERLDRRDHVGRVAAVVADARDLQKSAIDKIAAAAWIALEAISAVPSDADAIADFPIARFVADRLDDAGDFMSRRARVGDAGPCALLGKQVAVTYAARLDFDPNLSARRVEDFLVDEFE